VYNNISITVTVIAAFDDFLLPYLYVHYLILLSTVMHMHIKL